MGASSRWHLPIGRLDEVGAVAPDEQTLTIRVRRGDVDAVPTVLVEGCGPHEFGVAAVDRFRLRHGLRLSVGFSLGLLDRRWCRWFLDLGGPFASPTEGGVE